MPESVRLVAVGDLLLCGRYDEIARSGDVDSVFTRLSSVFGPDDLVVGNMECPLSVRGTPEPDKLCLRGHPAFAHGLAAAGFDVLSLANNHMFDYGPEAFRDTSAAMAAAGLAGVGAGIDLDAATRPVVVERGGLKIGFLAYCHASTKPSALAGAGRGGVAPLDARGLIADVGRWRGQFDQLVLLLHWGLEYSPLPTPEQVELAHSAVDAGVGLILGHHSHMLQGIETYRGAVIAYSLGNCTDSDVDWQGPTRHFSCRMTDTDREGLALTVELSREDVRVASMRPLWLNDAGQPEPAVGERARAILDSIVERSQKLAENDLARKWEKDLVDRRVMGPLRHWWSQGSLTDKVRRFRPAQLKTLYLLLVTFVRIRLSRSESRWSLFNSRNDTRPMPYAGDGKGKDQS